MHIIVLDQDPAWRVHNGPVVWGLRSSIRFPPRVTPSFFLSPSYPLHRDFFPVTPVDLIIIHHPAVTSRVTLTTVCILQ